MGPDTKRLITGMVVALGVLMLYNYALHWFYPNWKPDQAQNPSPTAQVSTTQSVTTTQATTTSATTTTVASTQTGPSVSAAPAQQGTWSARGGDGAAAAAKTVALGSAAPDDPKFAMAIDVSPVGAGIRSVVLNAFRQTAENKQSRYTFQEPYVIGGQLREDTKSLETRSVIIGRGGAVQEINLAATTWKVDRSDVASAELSVEVLDGQTPVARVVKTFKLSPRSDDPKTDQGYQVHVTHTVRNLTDGPIAAKVVMNGPTAPPRELERQPDQNFIIGYSNEGAIKVVSHPLAELSKDHPWKDFTKSDKGLSMAWAGAQSAYFNAIMRPIPRDPKGTTADWIEKVSGELINPDAAAEDQHSLLRLEGYLKEAPAKGETSADMEVYFGPKGRKVLDTEYYSAASRHYDATLVITNDSGIAWLCSICTFQWLINFLVMLLSTFHFVLRDWGLAIICLVLLVRLILHPVTKKSQVHMVKMQKMGPEMEKLKKKYADDKEALTKAQMQFYKEQGMTPVLGCLPMFLQMPIWIALWNALQSTFELRHAPFLYGFTWIKDLSKPDYLIHFNQPIKVLFFNVAGLNVLPILLGIVFYIQTKMQPKPATITPEQEQQQKMMTWMSTLLFPFMLYTGPSGLNLYIMTSTAFGIIESKVIRRHIAEREALEAKGPIIVDEPPPPKEGGGSKTGGGKPKAPKPTGWLARLQERAEQIRQDAQRPKR